MLEKRITLDSMRRFTAGLSFSLLAYSNKNVVSRSSLTIGNRESIKYLFCFSQLHHQILFICAQLFIHVETFAHVKIHSLL